MPNVDARETIQRFHERYPGVSARSFLQLHDAQERTTYDRVADAALAGMRAPRVLDLGCGDASVLQVIAGRDPDAQLSGIDFVASEIAIARAKLPKAAFVVGDLLDALPFAQASFDVVTAHFVLMLIGQLDELLASVSRVLRRAGRFVFAVDALEIVPNGYAQVLRVALDAAGLLKPDMRFDSAADVRLYQPDGMKQALAAHGFRLGSYEQTSFSGPVENDFAVQLILDSYPLGLVDDTSREKAAVAVRAWIARERRTIDVPVQFYVAERE